MKIFYTLSFLIILGTQAFGQARTPAPGMPSPEPAAKILKFYPNPAISFITFEFEREANKNYSFQIFNLLGKKVYENNSVTPRTVVNLADFFRGVYIFQLRDKGGRLIDSGKFQVSK
ncbi:MAG: T9SS type A sorting domain-containing protein [Candidatus Pseudobacter hemicellulosilyticus]|uniref:T9SS type A sorting domain-containing protein n=1 Tax=Candidatus Pseudobacter hemicellulosilyticus TaxID=3121375 RepID=A0AAJ5WUX9_9BACT|nr:MAG: T9SS type A sorting domain-containing protein [Pseudobacter sp.]